MIIIQLQKPLKRNKLATLNFHRATALYARLNSIYKKYHIILAINMCQVKAVHSGNSKI